MIINKKLNNDAKLPSIRILAKNLGISVITVKKAYELLESKNFITSVPGKGFFVTYISNQDIFYLIEKDLKNLISKAKKLNIPQSNIVEYINQAFKGDANECN